MANCVDHELRIIEVWARVLDLGKATQLGPTFFGDAIKIRWSKWAIINSVWKPMLHGGKMDWRPWHGDVSNIYIYSKTRTGWWWNMCCFRLSIGCWWSCFTYSFGMGWHHHSTYLIILPLSCLWAPDSLRANPQLQAAYTLRPVVDKMGLCWRLVRLCEVHFERSLNSLVGLSRVETDRIQHFVMYLRNILCIHWCYAPPPAVTIVFPSKRSLSSMLSWVTTWLWLLDIDSGKWENHSPKKNGEWLP